MTEFNRKLLVWLNLKRYEDELGLFFTGWIFELDRFVYRISANQGWTGTCTLVVLSLSTKFIKIATKICQFNQYVGTKVDMLFEIVKSVEIIIILGKTAIYPKILHFKKKHYSVDTFVHINLPKKPFFPQTTWCDTALNIVLIVAYKVPF